MTAELICTCPSGDGSLRWPCPSHPPESVDPAEAVVQLQLQLDASGSSGVAQYDPPGSFAAALAGVQRSIDAFAAAVAEAFDALRRALLSARPGLSAEIDAAMDRHPAGRLRLASCDTSADMSLDMSEPSRIYFPPAALAWVDADSLAERVAGQDLGSWADIVAGPAQAEIPTADAFGQPVRWGRHVAARRTWR